MKEVVEEWRTVHNIEYNVKVSNYGRAINNKGEIIESDEYGTRKSVSVGKNKAKLIHRLVAETFIPNPENKPEIDHIIPVSNGGSDAVWNLRWTTHEENMNNPITKLNARNKKRITKSFFKMAELPSKLYKIYCNYMEEGHSMLIKDLENKNPHNSSLQGII